MVKSTISYTTNSIVQNENLKKKKLKEILFEFYVIVYQSFLN